MLCVGLGGEIVDNGWRL